MTAELTAAEICSLLNLESNATCGSTRMSFVSQLSIAAGGLPAPFADGQPLGSALYFLVPIGFAVTVPAEGLVGRLTSANLLGAIALAIILTLLSRAFWRIGVRHYSGASA